MLTGVDLETSKPVPKQTDLQVPVISLEATDIITDSTGSRQRMKRSEPLEDSLDHGRMQSGERFKSEEWDKSDVWETKDETTKSTVKRL